MPPIIDIHVHAFPDSLAARAMEALEGPIDWKGLGDGTIGNVLQSMDAAGVDASVICNIATKPSQIQPIFDWSCQIRSPRIIPFPSIHPDAADAIDWLARIAEAGFRGIKLHPMYQGFKIDEPRMDPIYAALAETGLLLEMHCGDDIAFPGDRSADVDRIVRVIDRHKNLRLICTHLGAWLQWPAVREHLAGRDVWLETSMSVSILGLAATLDLIRAHGPERVLFGTDWPWTHPIDQLNLLRMLDLPREQIDAILGGNAAKMLGL